VIFHFFGVPVSAEMLLLFLTSPNRIGIGRNRLVELKEIIPPNPDLLSYRNSNLTIATLSQNVN